MMKHKCIGKADIACITILALLILVMSVLACPFASHATESSENGSDPDFHIYLAFGQSNMTGVGEIEAQDMICDDDYLVMCTIDSFQSEYFSETRTLGNWYKAVPPLSEPLYGHLGVADYFGRSLLEKKKTTDPDIRVGILVVSVAGAGIRMFDKEAYTDYYRSLPPEAQGALLPIMEEYGGNPYQRLIECAKEAQKAGVIKGIILHQGEGDLLVPGWADEVEKIYNDIITDLELDDPIPLVAGEVRNGTGFTDANLAINPLAFRNDHFHVVSAKDLTDNCQNEGDVHFTSEEYRALGKRYAEKMLEAEGAPGAGVDIHAGEYAVKNITTGMSYLTLDEAFQNADAGRHNDLELLRDTGLTNGSILNGKDVTLDLKGYSVDLKGHNLMNYGDLTIVNTGENARDHYFTIDRILKGL